MDSKTIELNIEDALALVQNALPILEAIPAIAPEAGLASLATSGAQVVTPILFRIGRDLADKGVTSALEQANTLARYQKVLDFSGADWQPSTQPAQSSPDPAPKPPVQPS